MVYYAHLLSYYVILGLWSLLVELQYSGWLNIVYIGFLKFNYLYCMHQWLLYPELLWNFIPTPMSKSYVCWIYLCHFYWIYTISQCLGFYAFLYIIWPSWFFIGIIISIHSEYVLYCYITRILFCVCYILVRFNYFLIVIKSSH